MNVVPEIIPSGWDDSPPVGAPSCAALTLFEPEGETEVVVETRVETELAGGQEFPAWSSLFLLEMGRQEGGTHIGPVEVRLRSENRGVRSLKMRVYLPGEVRETAWIQTQNPGFDLTVRWKADNTGGVAPNGFATMVVDGTPVTLGIWITAIKRWNSFPWEPGWCGTIACPSPPRFRSLSMTCL